MPLSIFHDSVTVKRPVISTKNGMEFFDWSNPVYKTISPCQVVAKAGIQEMADRTLNLTDKRLLRAPYDADVKAGDHVIWEGVEYAIEGEVYHSKSPTMRVATTCCTLIRWEG